jgi:hypothetical protein
MRRRVWFLFLVISSAALAVAWVVWGVPRAESFLRRYVETALTARLRRPVSLDRVRLHPLLLSATLEDLRVASGGATSSPFLFACRRWTVYLSPLHRSRRFPWFTLSIGKSVVEVPVLQVDLLPAAGRRFSFPLLPSHRLEWTGGSVHFPAIKTAAPFTLSDCEGTAVMTAGEATAELEGKTPWGPLRAVGRMGRPGFLSFHREGGWKVTVSLPEASLENLPCRLPDAVPGRGRGTVALTATLQGGFRSPVAERWALAADFKGASWTFDRLPWALSGRASVSSEEMAANGLSIGPFRLNGKIETPWTSPRWDLTLGAARFSLGELKNRLPWRPLSALPWRGDAEGTASVKGTGGKPDVNAVLKAENAGVGPLVFPSVSATLSSRADRIIIEAALSEGRLRAETARGQSRTEWEGHLEGLRLETLARAGGWGRVEGVLGGDFALRRSTDSASPLAGGVLRLENPAWGDARFPGTVVAYFSWKNDTIRFHNKEGTFDVLLQKTTDGWVLPRLVYSRSDGLALTGEGSLAGPALAFRGSLKQASLRDIPVLLARWPDAEGRWGADVTVDGTVSAPRVILSFDGGGARLRRDAAFHTFGGRARWEGGGFSLDDLRLDDGWKASGVRSSDGFWEVRAAVQGGDAAAVGEILRSSAPVSGVLNGVVSAWGGGGTPWQGILQVSGQRLRRGDLALSSSMVRMHWEPDLFRLDEFSVSLASRSFAWEAEARRRAPGSWDVAAGGSWIERATGRLRIGEGTLSLRDGKAGDGLSFEGDWDSIARGVRVVLSAENVPAAAVARRTGVAGIGRPGGALTGRMTLAGPLASPALAVSARWSGARWEDVSLAAELDGHWEGGPFVIEKAAVSEAGGGSLEVRGTVSRGPGRRVSLKVKAQKLPLALTGLPLGGAAGGEASLEGTLDDLRGPILLTAENLQVKGGPPVAVRVSAALATGTFTLEGGQAFTEDGRCVLRPGSTLRIVPNGMDFDAAGDLRNVQAGPFSLFGGLRLTGSWRSSPDRLTAALAAEDLWVNQKVFDQELARVQWSKGRLSFVPPDQARQRLTGAVDLSIAPQVRFKKVALWDEGDRIFLLDGELGSEGPWDFTLEGHGLEVATLLSLANLDVSGDGPVDVVLTGRGTGTAPSVEAEVVGRGGTCVGVPYDRLNASVLWTPKRIEMRSLAVSRRRGYVLTGRGEYVPPPEEDVPGRADFLWQLREGNLVLLKDLWSDCRSAKGSFDGELAVKPGPDGPVASGTFEMRGGSFRADRYAHRVSDLNVVLKLADNRVIVEDVSGRSGRGRFVIEGSVGLEGLRVGDFDLKLRTVGDRGISLEIPQLAVPPGPLFGKFSLLRKKLQAESEGEPKGTLTVKGPMGSHVVSGEVVLEDTRFTYPPAADAFRKGVKPWFREFWREATWDVVLNTGKSTWYRNEYVNARIEGRLAVRGPRSDLRVDGRLRCDQGEVTYLGQPFEVKKALFEAETDTRPAVSGGGVQAYISGEAEREATTMDKAGVASLDVVTMIVPRSRLGELRPRFVSRNNPGVSSERVFQKLLGFSSPDALQAPTAQEQDQLLRAGLVQLVGSSAGPFASRLAHLFGIDMISATYQPPTSLETGPSAQGAAMRAQDLNAPGRPAVGRLSDLLRGTGASAGVRLNDRVFGVYKFTVDQAAVGNQVYLHDEVQIVGRLVGNIYMKFSSELDARSFLGQPPNRQVLLERQRRFGLPRRKPKVSVAPSETP